MIRLATSILVLLVATTLTAGASAADLVAPQPDSVLTAGRTYTAAGTVVTERFELPGPVNPPRTGVAVYLTQLTRPRYVVQGQGHRPVERLALFPGALGVDLERWAATLKPTDRVVATGRFTQIYYLQGVSQGLLPTDAPSTGLEVTALSVNGTPVVPVSRDDAERLKKIAEQRVLELINQRPPVFDGPEPQIKASHAIDGDRVEVDVEFVGGWGHVVLPGMEERFLYISSTDTVVSLGHPTR